MRVEEVNGTLVLKGDVVTAGVVTRAGHIYPPDTLAQAARRAIDEVRSGAMCGTIGGAMPVHISPPMVSHIVRYLSLDGLTLRARVEVVETTPIGKSLAESLRKAMQLARHGTFYKCEFRLIGFGSLARDCVAMPDFRILTVNVTEPEAIAAQPGDSRPKGTIGVRDPKSGAEL